jgi:hypothetical protein
MSNRGGYFRAVDPARQIQQRRRTTIRLNKRDLDPVMENEENNLDEDTDSSTDNEGRKCQGQSVILLDPSR